MFGKCFNRQTAFKTMVDHAAICLDTLLSGSLADSDNQDLLLAELKDIEVLNFAQMIKGNNKSDRV